MKLPYALQPFRHGSFARYISGETVSMVGTWMQTFAQGYVLTKSLHAEASVLGWIYFAQGIPMLLLTLKGGSVADQYDKRLLIQAALLVQAISAIALGWLEWRGQLEIWHVFVAAVFLGTAAAFEVPAVSAFVPELVPQKEMAQAVAIDRSVFHATRLLGPAVGGYLVSVMGVASVYFVNALSYLPLMAAVLSIPRRPTGSEAEEETRRGGIRQGLAFAKADAPIRAMVLLIVSSTMFVSPFVVIMMPVYAGRTLGLDERAMGLLMAASGIGSLTGSLGVLAIRPGHRAQALKLGATVVVLGLSGMGLAQNFSQAVAALIVMLVGLSTCFSVANIVIQERAPNELRGRISAVAALAFVGIIPFSAVLVGEVIDHLGMRGAMISGAVCYGVVASMLLFGRHQLSSAPADPQAEAIVSAE